MASEACYYPAFTRGIVNYSKVLEHFKEQASTRGRIKLINSEGHTGRKGKLVILSMTAPCDNDKKGNTSDPPPVEVIDPTEADRKRALDKLQKEITKGRSSVVKSVNKSKNISNKRKGSRGGGGQSAKKIKKSQAATKTIVKRVKDIFD
jgi:hypothetical protein